MLRSHVVYGDSRLGNNTQYHTPILSDATKSSGENRKEKQVQNEGTILDDVDSDIVLYEAAGVLKYGDFHIKEIQYIVLRTKA